MQRSNILKSGSSELTDLTWNKARNTQLDSPVDGVTLNSDRDMPEGAISILKPSPLPENLSLSFLLPSTKSKQSALFFKVGTVQNWTFC